MRAQLRALLSDGRNAAALLARLKQRAEAIVSARGGVQFGFAATQTERMGQTAASPRATAPAAGALLPRIRGG